MAKPRVKTPTKAEKATRVKKVKPGPEKGTKNSVKPREDRPVDRPAEYERGAPPLFRHEYINITKVAMTGGLTMWELAELLGVSEVTIWRWRAQYPDFCSALNAGEEARTDRVKRAVFHRTVGYSFKSEKIFFDSKMGEVVRAPFVEHVPPSETLGIFWLTNRDKENWKRNQGFMPQEGEGDNGNDAVARFEALIATAEKTR